MFLVTLLIGLLMLVAGAELVVRGGGQLALALRVPALVVGLTVVAFGTSAPELAVSLTAAVEASADMALANVIGSNIANIALVLGLAALVRPLAVDRRLLRREVPTVLLLQALIPVFAWDLVIRRWEGAILALLGVVYNVWLVWEARTRRARLVEEEVMEELSPEGTPLRHLGLLAVGIAVIVFGAEFFVSGAVEVAGRMGLSERYIGLTVVALGTSAPEVATSVVSSWRGQADLAVGNAVGSNILNASMVLALTALFRPITLADDGVTVDLAVAMGVTLLLVPIVMREGSLGRLGGFVMTAGYLTYVFLTPS